MIHPVSRSHTTMWVRNSIPHGALWQANSSSASQEIPAPYGTHRLKQCWQEPATCTWSYLHPDQSSPRHATPPRFVKTHFSLILHFTSVASSKVSVSVRFPLQNPVTRLPSPPYVCCTSGRFHYPRSDHPNIWWDLNTTTPIMPLLQHPVASSSAPYTPTPSVYVLSLLRDQLKEHGKKAGGNILLYWFLGTTQAVEKGHGYEHVECEKPTHNFHHYLQSTFHLPRSSLM